MVENQLSRFKSNWTLHAYGDGAQGEWIRMQDDGNAAIYTENGHVSLWFWSVCFVVMKYHLMLQELLDQPLLLGKVGCRQFVG